MYILTNSGLYKSQIWYIFLYFDFILHWWLSNKRTEDGPPYKLSLVKLNDRVASLKHTDNNNDNDNDDDDNDDNDDNDDDDDK